MEHDNVSKRMYICMCDWVTLLYNRKLIEHCKPAITEKIKIILKTHTQTTPPQVYRYREQIGGYQGWGIKVRKWVKGKGYKHTVIK